ncbi:uncharacterized protein LOC131944133 isoform X2 [Physella acuta]|uniref:uncharacterized protein LOC131944133 isoform X2 n=1 Tax=Physella acuta TaxID=109671 RepID=UPI0027DC6F57|nr:uncharacterized protein LOC131944133 isoform X2 [Physella acuta]
MKPSEQTSIARLLVNVVLLSRLLVAAFPSPYHTSSPGDEQLYLPVETDDDQLVPAGLADDDDVSINLLEDISQLIESSRRLQQLHQMLSVLNSGTENRSRSKRMFGLDNIDHIMDMLHHHSQKTSNRNKMQLHG